MNKLLVRELCNRVMSLPIWKTVTTPSMAWLECTSCGVKLALWGAPEHSGHCMFGHAMDIIQELNNEEGS